MARRKSIEIPNRFSGLITPRRLHRLAKETAHIQRRRKINRVMRLCSVYAMESAAFGSFSHDSLQGRGLDPLATLKQE